MPYIYNNATHVVPINDVREHTDDEDFDWDWCDCLPTIETVENSDGQVLVVHNSWDGREESE